MFEAKCLHLYLVTDEASRCRHGLLDTVRMAVEGGVTLVQHRCKKGDAATQLAEARALKELLDELGVPLIINDNLELALAVDAAGLHIGQLDMSPIEARKGLKPHQILGLTVNNAAQLQAVPSGIIDYLGIGPVFPTISKKNPAPTLGVAGLAQLVSSSPLPVVAIGGIRAQDAPIIRQQAGAAGVAIVSAICAADDPRAAAQAFL
ncbi:MAG: thiamine phosphate synthase [Akkermansia sp.]